YYRQFGYELALNLGGNRVAFKSQVPKLKEGEQEPFNIRKATVQDVPCIAELYRLGTSRSVIASVRDEAHWRYDVEGRSETSAFRGELQIIETPDGKLVGLLDHATRLWG